VAQGSRSANGQCVEVARLPQAIAVATPKSGPKLIFTRHSWAAFVEGEGRAVKHCRVALRLGSFEDLAEVPL
jgi:hypothetical protein